MVCNRCGAGIPPGYAGCVRCGAWAQVPQAGWPYAQPGYGPRQPAGGQQYYVPGYYYQQQPATAGAQWPHGYGYNPPQGREAGRGDAAFASPRVYTVPGRQAHPQRHKDSRQPEPLKRGRPPYDQARRQAAQETKGLLPRLLLPSRLLEQAQAGDYEERDCASGIGFKSMY